MAERALRGTRLGATSYENDRHAGLDAPLQDPEERLADDRAVHLGHAVLALDERDRYLGDAQPGPEDPHRDVNLERVASGLHVGQVDLAQRRRAVGAVAAGGVL